MNDSALPAVDSATGTASPGARVLVALRRVVGALGSFSLAVTLLLTLGVLTLLGTLAQRSESLFDVQRRFFDAILVVIDVGPISIPLPGAALVLGLLCLNLLVGGVVRLRKGSATIGILVAHLGILTLFGGGLVEALASDKGQMTVYEAAGGAVRGEAVEGNSTSSHFESLYEWELSVGERRRDGSLLERVIPGDRLERAAAGTLRASAAGLAFDVVVSEYVRNGRPRPSAGADGASAWEIEALDAAREAERNFPAARVALVAKGAASGPSAVVWGRQRFAWATRVGGTDYEIDLRRRSWDFPFAIRLDRFVHETHPGTQIDSRFSSYVTKIEDGTEQSVHITMNEPLRHRGFTFYQSSWGPPDAAPGTRLYSTFSVVHNPSDRVPIVACAVIAAGLLIHLGRRLRRHVVAESRQRGTIVVPTLSKSGVATGRRRPVLVAVVAATALVLLGAGAFAWTRVPAPTTWTRATIEAAAALPMQDGGRVKPLESYANVTLLRLAGRRTCADEGGRALSSVEWLLDVLLRPETARRYRCLLVEDSQVLDAVGLPRVEGRDRRDRYSFEELAPCRERLAALARDDMRVERRDRGPVESGIVDLSGALETFDTLSHFLDFARGIPLPAAESFRALWPGTKTVLPLEVAEKSADIGEPAPASDPHAGVPGAPPVRETGLASDASPLGRLRSAAFAALSAATRLLVVPPDASAPAAATWASPGELLASTARGTETDVAQARIVDGWAALVERPDDPTGVERAMTGLRDASTALARARGEYEKVPLELFLGRLDPFARSIFVYLAAFVLLALSWAVPSKWLRGGALALLLLGVALHGGGIVLRSVLRGRPPISTLYDTTLFIAWIGVAGLLVAERIHRRGVALAMAPVMGALLLFVGQRFETLKAEDTLPQLVAVLDTNFWLALHVTCITLGYGGGLLASAVAHVHVIGRASGFRSRDREFYALLSRMTYGMLGFSLFFSVVGTILGGIWANESWGRFWGWDPKENGALMICIAELSILHARLGGLLRPFGVAVATIANGGVIAFSWWGVNLLGIGLHSYGFTGGILRGLTIFYVAEGVVIGAAAATYVLGRSGAGATQPAGGAASSVVAEEGRSSSAAS